MIYAMCLEEAIQYSFLASSTCHRHLVSYRYLLLCYQLPEPGNTAYFFPRLIYQATISFDVYEIGCWFRMRCLWEMGEGGGVWVLAGRSGLFGGRMYVVSEGMNLWIKCV